MKEEEKQHSSDSSSMGGVPDPNAWLVTFTDLVMLLLTFFVMMFSSRAIDKDFLKDHFRAVFKYVNFEDAPGDAIVTGKNRKMILGREMLKREISTFDDLKQIQTREDSRGISISLASDALFMPGDARMPLSGWHLMNSLGKFFRQIDNDIIIMGHTDNIPVKNEKFSSNWELSAERALSVARYLGQRCDIPAGRIAAGGYGESRPAFKNDTDKNRAKNRRIEFILRRPR